MNFAIPSNDDPVRQLLDEHEIFMAALEELAATLVTLSDDATTIPEDILWVVERTWEAVNEHLNVHFVKEEEIFFPYIESMVPGARVKFQFLHVDHDRLRESFEEFTMALQNYRARCDAKIVRQLKHVAEAMVRWFYYHIVAEDTIYFDIAKKTMSPLESAEVLAKMRAMEARLREIVPEPVPDRAVDPE